MSALKSWAMSDAGQRTAQRTLARAEAQWSATLAACALARGVDAATLELVLHRAACRLGDAHEQLAIAQGHDSALAAGQ